MRDPRPRPVFAEAGVELDDGVDGAAVGGESPHEQLVGSRVPATSAIIASVSVSCPPSHCHVVSSVAVFGRYRRAIDRGRHAPGPSWKLPAFGATDESAEHGLSVEAGDAHPVDGAVGSDERGGAGVADESVVLDRTLDPGARSGAMSVRREEQPERDAVGEVRGDRDGGVCGP